MQEYYNGCIVHFQVLYDNTLNRTESELISFNQNDNFIGC